MKFLLLLGSGVQTNYASLKPVEYERSMMSTTLNENVRLPEILDEDLAYLIGYMHGDGYVQIGKKVNWQAPKAVKMATADAHPQIRQRLVDIVERAIQPHANDGRWRWRSQRMSAIYSRLVVEWLIQNGLLKAKAEDIRVPEAIFRSPSSVVAAFITGYFDADGCDRGRKGGYGIDSISRAMLEDVQQLLLANGIVSHISATDRSAQGWQTIYRLIVSGAEFKARLSAFMNSTKDLAREGKRNIYNNYPTEAWYGAGRSPANIISGVVDITKGRISYRALDRIHERLVEDDKVEWAEQVESLMRVMPDTITAIVPVGEFGCV